ncbi:MAG: CheR family methyltransferase [Burkholderiales bacterium]
MKSLQPATFKAVVNLFHQISGIRLADSKQALVYSRLQKLALEAGVTDVEEYAQRVIDGKVSQADLVAVVDRLTTNETYFFREPQHFEDLRRRVLALPHGHDLRIWSSAASSGEEAYSIAMLLADVRGLDQAWAIWGTDLSTAMVQAAQQGLYPLERARNVSPDYLRRFCRKGQGAYEGQLLMARELRERTQFLAANLMEKLPAELPQFDVIFLRNVLTYFDPPAKAAVVRRVIEKLKPDGVLYTGHAEPLTGLELPLRALAPAVYLHA